jgi:hypothetical protein
VIDFANKKQPSPSTTKVTFMSTTYIFFYIQLGTKESPPTENGIFSDPKILNENENVSKSVPKNIIIRENR